MAYSFTTVFIIQRCSSTLQAIYLSVAECYIPQLQFYVTTISQCFYHPPNFWHMGRTGPVKDLVWKFLLDYHNRGDACPFVDITQEVHFGLGFK